jgi:hypothetical protein
MDPDNPDEWQDPSVDAFNDETFGDNAGGWNNASHSHMAQMFEQERNARAGAGEQVATFEGTWGQPNIPPPPSLTLTSSAERSDNADEDLDWESLTSTVSA